MFHLLLIFLDPLNEATTYVVNLSCCDLEAKAYVDEANKVYKMIVIFVMEEVAAEDDGCNVLTPK